MIQRQVFSAGFKPLATDFSAIGLNRQAAFKLLLSAFTLDASGVLFDAIAPTANKVGTVFTLSTPGQLVAVEGALAESATYQETFDVDNGSGGENDLYVSVFFVVRQTPVTETRNFLSTVPSSGAQILQNLTAEVAQQYVVDVVYLSSATNGDTQTPVIGSDDVGFVKLAEFWCPSGASPTITVNETARYSLPAGASSSITAHAASHLPGGSDPLPVAELSETLASGSTLGLMPEGALSAALGSVQGVIAAGDSGFLSFASQTDDSGSGSQVVSSLRTDNSLTAAGTPTQLGLNFLAPSSLNGQSSRPARSDHTHALSETGMVVVNKTFAVSSNNMGTIQDVVITAADTEVDLEQILDVTFYWEPNNVSPNDFVRLAAPWTTVNLSSTGVQTVGARAMITGTNSFRLELGTVGVTYLTESMQIDLGSRLTTGYTGNNYPTDGTLHMVITALREGTNG